MRTVSCLGPKGSYSELAAKTLCPDCTLLLCNNFYEVVEKLVTGACDRVVLPIENSIQGGIVVNLDLISDNDLVAVEEAVLNIDHRLATKAGVRLSDITKVYSHEQAIGQCSTFLSEKLPRAKCLYSNSTAESLSKIDEHTAGIVGAHIREEGVVLSEKNIADDKRNCTRFMLVERREKFPARSRKVLFVAETAHVPGELLTLLQVFARYQINLERISSRPVRKDFGRFRFFVEIEGDIADPAVQNALKEAEKLCRQFRILGAYD